MPLPAAPIVDSAPPAIKMHPSIVDSVVLATDARRGTYWSRPGHEGCYLLWSEGYEITIEYRPDYDTDEVAVDVAVEMVEEALAALRDGDDEDEEWDGESDHEEAEFVLAWDGDEDDAFLAAVERHLDQHCAATFTVRRPRAGEAPATYQVRADRTLQVLGYSIPKPEWLREAEEAAFNAACGVGTQD